MFEGDVRPTLSKNSISYGSWNHSDTRKRLGDESSSLDLRAEKCDLTSVFALESHFLLKYDLAMLRHILVDMILSWLKRQIMIIFFQGIESFSNFIILGG